MSRNVLCSLVCPAVLGALVLGGCTSPTVEVTSSPTTVVETTPIGSPIVTEQIPTDGWSILPYTPPKNGESTVLMNDNGDGIFIFGMTIDAFHNRCDELGWKCDPSSGVYDYGYASYRSALFGFTGGPLDVIWVSGTEFQTERGFRVGDSRKKLFQLYGNDYRKDTVSETNTYTYVLPSTIVLVVFYDTNKDKAKSWYMSTSE